MSQTFTPEPAPGDVVLVDVPFTDLAQRKKRPAVVLLAREADYLVVFVTSRVQRARSEDVLLSPTPTNGLAVTSVALATKLFTVHASLVLRVLGHLEFGEHALIVERLSDALNKPLARRPHTATPLYSPSGQPPAPLIAEADSLNLDGFLSALASRTPTPGGGAAAGACGAIACALAEMVAAYSVAKAPAGGGGQASTCSTSATSGESAPDAVLGIRTRLAVCRRMLRQLMDEDAAAYEAMTAARREAKADPARKPAYESAVLAATRVPMEIVAASATVLSLMDELKERASRYLLSDLGAAAAMALAAARAADYSVRVNVPGLPEGTARDAADEADRMLERAAQLAEAVETFVRNAARQG